jgi:hypothetical protein
MSERALQLAARRAALLAESERLRRSLGEDGAALAQRLGVVEQIFAVGRSGWVRPLLVGAAGLLMVGRTRRIVSIVSRLAVVYPLIKRVVQLFSRPPSRGRGRDPQFPRDRAGSPDTSESP